MRETVNKQAYSKEVPCLCLTYVSALHSNPPFSQPYAAACGCGFSKTEVCSHKLHFAEDLTKLHTLFFWP